MGLRAQEEGRPLKEAGDSSSVGTRGKTKKMGSEQHLFRMEI